MTDIDIITAELQQAVGGLLCQARFLLSLKLLADRHNGISFRQTSCN